MSDEQRRALGVSFVLLAMSLLCSTLSAKAAEPQLVSNHFDESREGWRIYDYNGGKPGGGNVFFPATWEKSGGVEDSGYIWADDSKWRVDVPEQPHSILPFIIYRDWVDGKALDIRGAKLSVFLRGDKLDLKGARCLFWAFNRKRGTRYHYTGEALKVSAGEWGRKQTIVLKNETKLWHASWSRMPDKPATLDEVLRECDSYGVSFVGFSDEVTGRFAMDELVIEGSQPETSAGWKDGKRYEIEGLRVSLSQPVVVARSKSFLWFPTLARFSNGDLMATISNYPDTQVRPDDSTALFVWSKDGGLTWGNKMVARYGDAHLTLPNGDELLLPHYLRPLSKGVMGAACSVRPRGQRHIRVMHDGVRVSGWSGPDRSLSPKHGLSGFMFNGQSILLKDGRYLVMLYGYLKGDRRHRLVTAVSKNGVDWKVRATIGDPNSALAGTDGPCESAVCRLKDGRLMCVFRLGSFTAFGKSFSDDEGQTWSEPVLMQGVFSVQPSLAMMKDGMVALSGGRPGVFLWINRDGDGEAWEKIEILANHNKFIPNEPIAMREWKTSSYTEIVALDDRHLLFIYDRTPHGISHDDGWKDIPDDSPETNSVWVVRVTVEKTADN